MAVFDSNGTIHRLKTDQGIYDMEVAILLLCGADYLGRDLAYRLGVDELGSKAMNKKSFKIPPFGVTHKCGYAG